MTHAEKYLCDRELGLLPARTVDIFFHILPSANKRLDRVIERHFHVTPLARYFYGVNARLPGGKAHVCELGNGQRDRARDHVRAFKTKPHIRLNRSEEAEARRMAEERMGIGRGDRFICFSARDHAYLSSIRPEYRQQMTQSGFRNSTIENYLPAAQALARRGYFVLRMGAIVERAIESPHPRVIDYASKHRDELLDLYLGFNCHMFLSDHSGTIMPALVNRRPVAYANLSHFDVLHGWQGLVIPKRVRLPERGRFMSFPEMIESGAVYYEHWSRNRFAPKEPMEMVENTPEEIRELALEMDDRITGKWVEDAEERAVQRRFQELAGGIEQHLGGAIHTRIAMSFLRRHPDFLG